MTRLTDRTYLRTEQYRDDSNLRARIELHRRFSTSPQDWPSWLWDQLVLPEAELGLLRQIAQQVAKRRAWRLGPRWRLTSSYPSRSCWRTVSSLRCLPVASRRLTAVRAHERARTIPKLHSAHTVAWGLLKWDR